MSVQATGFRTDDGALELHREFSLSEQELWAYLVESEYLATWFGTWQGDASSGTVDVTMLAEEGAPTMQATILKCDKIAHQLHIQTGEGEGSWRLELSIEPADKKSRLVFRMPGIDPAMAGSVGPGWDYYLDRLVAAIEGGNVHDVNFEADYYPALSGYYEDRFRS